MRQCQCRTTERFLVAVALTGYHPVWLRHNFTAPPSGTLQTRWGQGEREKPDTQDTRLGIEPIPENLCGVWNMLIGRNDRPSPVVHGARAAIGRATMPL